MGRYVGAGGTSVVHERLGPTRGCRGGGSPPQLLEVQARRVLGQVRLPPAEGADRAEPQ